MKKGFTLIEMLISISILVTIFLVVAAIYQMSLREYPINIAKTNMQTEINFSADSIAQTIKNSLAIAPSYNEVERSSSKIILELPTINTAGEFVYGALGENEKDYYIYEQSGDTITKKLFGNDLGINQNQEGVPIIILKNVKYFSCSYSNQVSGRPNFYKTAQCEITIEKNIAGKTISYNVKKTMNARNAP